MQSTLQDTYVKTSDINIFSRSHHTGTPPPDYMYMYEDRTAARARSDGRMIGAGLRHEPPHKVWMHTLGSRHRSRGWLFDFSMSVIFRFSLCKLFCGLLQIILSPAVDSSLCTAWELWQCSGSTT